MSGNLAGGGLLELAVALASGFLLCKIDWVWAYLRRQPAPVPYFTFLAVGVGWWMIVPALVSMLTSFCGWLGAVSLSGVCLPTAGQFLGEVVGDKRRAANVFSSALALWLAAWAISRMFGRRASRRLSLEGWEFERMVDMAIAGKTLLMLTLRSRKVYVGRPYRVFPDYSRQDKWVGFLPWRSGHREESSLELTWTTYYEEALGGPAEWETAKAIAMCIPLRDIVSCQFFQPELYSRFRAGQFREAAESGPAHGGENGRQRTGGELTTSGDAATPAKSNHKRDKEQGKK